MASSALKSELRSTACLQPVDQRKLRSRSTGRRRRSVGNCHNGASPNGPPRSRAARCRAIGKPTSCCSPDTAKGCWFSTNDKPASASFEPGRSKGCPHRSDHRPPTRQASTRCAKPSASTTEPSSPSITGFTRPSASKPSSAIPIVPGKRAAWKTPSGGCDACCPKTDLKTISPLPSNTSFSASTPTQMPGLQDTCRGIPKLKSIVALQTTTPCVCRDDSRDCLSRYVHT